MNVKHYRIRGIYHDDSGEHRPELGYVVEWQVKDGVQWEEFPLPQVLPSPEIPGMAPAKVKEIAHWQLQGWALESAFKLRQRARQLIESRGEHPILW